MTTLRERFFNRLEGTDDLPALFVPDLSSWYQAHRIDVTGGKPQKYGPGELIPEGDPLHELPGTMPPEYRHLTHLGLHRELSLPIPVHNYHWLDVTYDGVEYSSTVEGVERTDTWLTPHGDLVRRWRLAVDDGSWAIVDHPVKSSDDFPALADVYRAQRYSLRAGQVEALADEIGEMGFQDIVLARSPVGLLVHEFIGMVNFVYVLFDNKHVVEEMLELLEERCIEAVRLAASTPARLVILGDNLDENLLAPPVFREYGLPYYRKVARILHDAGKFFSCHMDGNIKGLLPLFSESGLDLYDGCTPEPMNNYRLEDLRDALGPGMHAFTGIPSTLFAQGLDDAVILDYAGRIVDVMGEKAIMNVGDILPVNGDIRQVAEVARLVSAL